MLEIVGWNVGMSGLAATLLILGAIVIGIAAQVVGDVTTGWEGVIAGVAAGVGAWLGSEAFGTLSTWGYAFEGLYVLPAVIGAVVLAFVVDAVVRFSTQGSYVHHARPI